MNAESLQFFELIHLADLISNMVDVYYQEDIVRVFHLSLLCLTRFLSVLGLMKAISCRMSLQRKRHLNVCWMNTSLVAWIESFK